MKKYLIFIFLLIFFSSQSVFAAKVILDAYMDTFVDKEDFYGRLTGEQFGGNVFSGNFDGDNFEDLVIAAPFASIEDKQWNGAVRIIFGDSDGFYSETEFLGANSGDQLGTTLAVGDFNHDGFDDLAMSSYNNYSSAEKKLGIYIMYGGAQLASQTIDFAFQKPANYLTTEHKEDGFGLSLASADLNNDRFDDLLIGAPFADSTNSTKVGAVYGYFGSNRGLAEKNQVTFYGKEQNSRFGGAIIAGYFINKDIMSLAIGAHKANVDNQKDVGRVYFYAGQNSFQGIINLPDKILEGNSSLEWLGFNLAAGDTNNDGYDDLAVASFPYSGERADAKIQIFNGGEDFSFKKPDIVVDGYKGEALPGADIALEDLNGDFKAEIIIGAPGINDIESVEAGDAYIIYSGEQEYENLYRLSNNDATSYLHGENADDWFGYSLKSLDFNGDGYKDLAVSSRYADTEIGINTGKVSLLWGRGKNFGNQKTIVENTDIKLNRGEFVKIVFDRFNLKESKKEVIEECKKFLDFCLFNFSSMSSYDDMKLADELILYPDIQPGNSYYEEINIATMLGLVSGYTNEKDTPFHPELPISRIQALKVIMGATDLLPPKYKFELLAGLAPYENLASQKTIFLDIDTKIAHMWWYPRYVNFALEKNIIEQGDYFRPDDNITVPELEDMINKTLEILNVSNEEVDS